MCGRASLDKKNIPKEHRFKAKLEGVPFDKNFDIRPSQQLPIILPDANKALLATWASPEKEPDGKPALPFNIKQENLLVIPRFRALLPRNRCIIPIDGFFEWKELEAEANSEQLPLPASGIINLDLFGNPILTEAQKKQLKEKKARPQKQRYRFTLIDKEPFGLAGLWRESLDYKTGELTKYFSIITTSANQAVTPYHDRMPVILPPENEEIWLNNKLTEKRWYNVLMPFDGKKMAVMPVDEYESTLGNYIAPKLNSI